MSQYIQLKFKIKKIKLPFFLVFTDFNWMLRTLIKGTLKMANFEVAHLSPPLLIRSNNSYTMKSRPSHKSQLSFSVPKKKIEKIYIYIYILVLYLGHLVQNIVNKAPCVCNLLNYSQTFFLSLNICLEYYHPVFSKKYFGVYWPKKRTLYYMS